MPNYELATRYVCEAMGKYIIPNGNSTLVPGAHGQLRYFRPHESIADAWVLVEWIQRNNAGWRFSILGGDTSDSGFFGWRAEFFGHFAAAQNYGQRHASTRAVAASLAIFLAACKVLLTDEQLKECGI